MSTVVTKRQSLAGEAYVVRLAEQSVLIPSSPQHGIPAAVKRLLDLTFAVLVIVALLPLLIVVALAIVVNSGWPVLFCQKRLGLAGKEFTLYKFRSMSRNAEMMLQEVKQHNEIKDGPIFKWRKDPRITGIGKILRQTSLDELPQLFNVLLGQMSLVGPRPPLESEVTKYEEWQLRRLSVKPGMTGLWQVSGRSDLTFVDMVRLDLEYVDSWSWWKDLTLLARTPAAVIIARGAF